MKALYILAVVIIVVSMGNADYSIVWYTIDGGGGTSSGGQYQLTGTIAQSDAGYHDGGSYELLGGFWVGGPLCIVNFEQFATVASYWLEVSCDAGNNDCGGADLDAANGVNIDDLNILAGYWLDICPFGWPLE